MAAISDKEALAYLLEHVLQADADAPVTLALERARVRTASDLMSLEVSQDLPLMYDHPTEGKNIPLLPAEMCCIRGLKDYIRYHMTNVANKYYESLEDWEKLTAKNFVSFRVNIAPTLPPNVTPSAQVQVTKPSPVTNDPLRDWKKGTKRDMNIFKELKRTKEWKQWDTQFRADVATQGLSNVLDPRYIPATYEDKMLFREQQCYMYAVFVRVLKMDKGKDIIRKYKGIFDAQSIYQELQEYASKSTQAAIDANTLLRYITIASLSDGSWNGTTRHFVLHWMEQVQLYEELVDISAALSDSEKLTLLTNAVRGHTKLSGVHNVAIQLASPFGQAVDFTKYLEMLLSECAQVDSALAHSPHKSGQQSVYFTDLTIDDGEEDAHHQHSSADEVDYTIDSDPVTLMGVAHKHHEMSASCVLMHQDQWTGMSPEGQKIWDPLLGEDKAVILKKKPTSNLPKPSRTFYNRKPSRENDASPADLCNILSTSSKVAANKPHQANTCLTYTVGKHRADKPGALIDRGANRGVAGADMRVIRTTHRAVNVQGVSDHQVTDLKIVTAGGVVQTQHGPVIVIFHQYAHLGTGKTIHSSFQLKEFGLEVDKAPIRLPRGLLRIKTPDGYVHPIRIKGGLPYVSLRPYTDMEWETLPHVNWTRDSDWDSAIFNHEFNEGGDEWYDALTDHTKNPHGELFDKFGNYCRWQAAVAEENFVGAVLDGGLTVDNYVWYVNQVDLSKRQPEARHVKPGERDWETLRRFFSWASVELVEKTFQAMMQMDRLSNAVHLKKHYRSPNPALNVRRRKEPVAMDYAYCWRK